jgi:DNA-binding transcriptional LysR family regulator
MDHLDSLKVFVAVADARGLAGTARQLRLSAPVVTRAIAGLEQRLGAQLVQRNTRSARLTDIGERFLGDCRRILGDLAEAESSASGAHSRPQGELSITAPAMLGHVLVAPIALDFLALHPEVTIRGVFLNRIVHLIDEGVDVAVRISRLPDSGLKAVRVGSMRRVVIASPAYLAERGEPRSPADLHRHEAVGYSQIDGAVQPWSFGRGRVATQPRVRFTTNASETAVAAAVLGHGLARALRYQVDAEVKAGRLQIVLAEYEPEPIPVHLLHAAGRMARASLRSFIDFAAQRLRAEPLLR